MTTTASPNHPIPAPALADRDWLPPAARALIAAQAQAAAGRSGKEQQVEIERLIGLNLYIHEHQCLNLNPATNTMNPKAESAMAAGLGVRPSLGYAGEKYEAGLEGVEAIETIAAELACRVFGARYVEFRVPSGAMANLMGFMATTRPGDIIISPPADIAGHVTHARPGAAGLYGLKIHPAPVDATRYTIDIDALRMLALRLRPKLITCGQSLNLTPHDVPAIRAIADQVGAKVLFDAAHLSGPIAGGAWPNPLAQGAHLMTMSTYKSLGGPPAGLVLTNEPDLARRLEQIAFPGLTANYDAGRAAALAITLTDWQTHGAAYAADMIAAAQALEQALREEGLSVFGPGTQSHQLALWAAEGGQAMARRLRRANILACGIGLPNDRPGPEGDLPGLRLGTNELVRWGMGTAQMPLVARLIARALRDDPALVAPEVQALRARYRQIGYILR